MFLFKFSVCNILLQSPRSSFFWQFLGGRPWQGEVECLLRQQLSETHGSRQWPRTLYFLWEVLGHRCCCWCSGWRQERLCSLDLWWEGHTGFPMKQGILTFARAHLLLSKGCSQGELGKESTYLFRDALYIVVGYFDHTLYTPGADNNVYLELEGRASC